MLARLLSAFSALGAAAYLVGLVVTNLSLSRAGAYNLDLAHARYVIVGLAFLCVAGIPAFIMWQTGVNMAASLLHETPLRIAVSTGERLLLLVVLAALPEFLSVLMFSAPMPFSPIQPVVWFEWFVLTLSVGLFVGFAYALLRLDTARAAASSGRVEVLKSLTGPALMAGVLGAIFVFVSYADHLFPQLSYYWGGGNAAVVDLWPVSDRAEQLAKVFGVSTTTVPIAVCLVDESSDSYLLRPFDGSTCTTRIVTVPRQEVIALVPRTH